MYTNFETEKYKNYKIQVIRILMSFKEKLLSP